MKRNKYDYLWIIQSYTGGQYGWEDECAEDNRREAVQRRKEYRENSPMPCRIIFRRVLATA